MVTTIHVDGMRSVHCVRAVFTALNAVDGIASAEVSMGRAVLEHDGRASAAEVTAAVEALGYSVREVSEQRRRLVIRGDHGEDSTGS